MIRRIGGELVGSISCCATDTVVELKAKVEQKTGLDPATLALYRPSTDVPLGDHESVSSLGVLAELYVVVLQRVDVAGVVGIAASELTEEQLELGCTLPECNGDIIVLKGCSQVNNLQCLALLDQIQVLDISGCNAKAVASLATVITKLK